jgi:hypothetical protein
MFFSEEKNQKTFASALAYRSGAWPGRAVGWALEHDPAICGQPPDKRARQNKELERDASGKADSNRSHPALAHHRNYQLVHFPRPSPASLPQRRKKSLLLLFFRKEDL